MYQRYSVDTAQAIKRILHSIERPNHIHGPFDLTEEKIHGFLTAFIIDTDQTTLWAVSRALVYIYLPENPDDHPVINGALILRWEDDRDFLDVIYNPDAKAFEINDIRTRNGRLIRPPNINFISEMASKEITKIFDAVTTSEL